MQEVYDFLKKTGTYYLATCDGMQARVRPFGTIDLFKGRLYIQTGRRKDVSRQIKCNPNVEICAFDGDCWLRLSGVLELDDDRDARVHMLDSYPELKRMYDADDGNTEVFFFRKGTAVFSSFSGSPDTVVELQTQD